MSLLSFRSLTWKFSLFYIALALGALFMARSIALLVEYHRFSAALERGWLTATAEKAAAVIGAGSDQGLPSDALLQEYLGTYLRSLGGTAEDSPDTEILQELTHPLAATLTSADGIRRVGVDGTYRTGRAAPFTIAAGEIIRRNEVPITDAEGRRLGSLLLELRVPAHIWQVLFADSLEWMTLVNYMIVFTLGSGVFLAVYLSRRLQQIDAVAAQWETGDLSAIILESSPDEFGRLARRLNKMTSSVRAIIEDRAEQATLTERQRLARGLHDTIKQRVLALNLQLATALRRSQNASEELATSLSEARQLTREIQDQLTTVVTANTTVYEPMTFAGELRHRADSWSRRGNFRARTHIADVPHLPAPAYECILAIVDEALANVMRHSKARAVDIFLGLRSGHDFALIVADDGVGAARGIEGFGIGNMRARAGQLPMGRFAMNERPGDGTEVIVTWRAERVSVRSAA